MCHRTLTFLFLLSVPLLLSTSTFAQDKKKEASDQTSKWTLQKSYEELKEITQKEHDPELELEELKILPKPGIYKSTLKVLTDSEDQPKKRKYINRVKYIDGKYVVHKAKTDEGYRWSINTFDKSCTCFRSWTLDEDQVTSLLIGNRIDNKPIITWSIHDLKNDKKHIVNGYSIISKDRMSWRAKQTTVFDKYSLKIESRFSFEKPLSNKEKGSKKHTKTY